MVKVVPLEARDEAVPRRLGFLAGEIAVPDDFDRMGQDEIERRVRRILLILLIDTHLLLWAAGQPERLSRKARRLLEDPSSQLWFSAASLWEVAIKHALGRNDFRVEPNRLRRALLANGWHELGISSDHALATLGLPAIHKDPFDRMLIAQAHVEGVTLVTSDDIVAEGPGQIRNLQ